MSYVWEWRKTMWAYIQLREDFGERGCFVHLPTSSFLNKSTQRPADFRIVRKWLSYIHFCNTYCTTAKIVTFSLTYQCVLQTSVFYTPVCSTRQCVLHASVPSLSLLRFQAKALQQLALIQGDTCSLLTQSCVSTCTLRPGPERCNKIM